jgi:sugar phosphate isomerase/epimerase
MKNVFCAIGAAVTSAVVFSMTSLAADSAAGTGACFKGPLGLQLYSLRDAFPKDVPGTLDLVKNFSIRYAELAGTYNLEPEKFRGMMIERGIQPIAAHMPYEKFKNDPESIAKEAKALGLKYAGVAWIPHKGKFTEKDARDAAAVFNKAGEVLSKYGIKCFYHNHGYEFEPFGNGTLMDLLITETKAEYMTFEMDVLWTFFPGQDPAALLRKHGNRWELMHLKDLKKGVQTGDFSGKTDKENDVPLGAGQLDLAATLKAAAEVGVKYYFIEDESSQSKTQIPQSMKYLEQIKW